MEYNYARSFHGLGIPHLAAKHYELVLTSVRMRMDEALEEDEKPIMDLEMADNGEEEDDEKPTPDQVCDSST